MGPAHEYVAPTIVPAVKLKVLPTHTGVLLDADGADGNALITTVVVPAGPVHPPADATTEYVPAFAVVTLVIIGFCVVEPVLHKYVAPMIVLAVKLKLFPAQTGELLPAIGAAGVGLIVTVVVPALLVGHPPTVAVTE